MNGKEVVTAIFNRKSADRVGFWLGNPTRETKGIYYKYFGIDSKVNLSQQDNVLGTSALLTRKVGFADLELAKKIGSDFMWITPEFDSEGWNHPEGKPMFDAYMGRTRKSLNEPGFFSECTDIKEVEAFRWPNPDYLDFSLAVQKINMAMDEGMGIFGGMWMQFFHILCDLFGMDNYFIKMYTDPGIVEAVTRKVLDFYLEANKRCLDIMGPKIDAVFFGNDFGSQRDLLISPEMFKKFILPGFKEIIDQAKSYNLKTVLHSCGAISKVIPLLIDAGVDALHPLQAKARDMDAEKLAREFKNDIVFIGGVDTQELLPFGTPQEVKEEVRRIKRIFGERFIVSPSHEALLPNVSLENVIAMRDAALE